MSIRHLLLFALTLGSTSLAQPQEPPVVAATQSAHPFSGLMSRHVGRN